MTFAQVGSKEVLWKVGNRKLRDLFIGVNSKKLDPGENYREVTSTSKEAI